MGSRAHQFFKKMSKKLKKEKTWLTTKEIIKLSGKSRSTIERRKNELLKSKPNHPWIRIISSRRILYHFEFLSLIIPFHLFVSLRKINQLRRVIYCLYNHGSLEQLLAFTKWNWFVTITYNSALNPNLCYDEMNNLFDRIAEIDENSGMFFTTEPHANGLGHHNHLVIKTKLNKFQLDAVIAESDVAGRVDLKKYSIYKAGVAYASKEGLKGELWDLKGNVKSKFKSEIIDSIFEDAA